MKDYIINDDCLTVMSQIPDKSIDLIICDLPYGITKNKYDCVIPFTPLWAQYKRIIKDRGAILLFGQGLFFHNLIESNKKMYRYDLVWDKGLTTGFLNAKKMPLRQHEQIGVFYKRLPTYNPQFKEGQPSHGRGTAYLEKEHKNSNYGKFATVTDKRKGATQKYPTSILRFPKNHPSKSSHPTQKSIDLLEYLIKTYSNEGDTVLDNCMGSGSTILAAVNTNRHYIGIEIQKKYCESLKQMLLERGVTEPLNNLL